MRLAIFDLDDTLINFAATREIALRSIGDCLQAQGIDAQAFLAAFSVQERLLFGEFEHGLISRHEYRMRRFREPLRSIGVHDSAERVTQLNKIFMDCVNDAPLLYDDVLATLQRLHSSGIQSAILTNGPSDGQRRKLRATGLADIVDFVGIGEELGFSKPLPQAFHAVVGQVGCQPVDAVMVGDSPQLDYDAAIEAGLAAVLLDRDDLHREGDRATIRSLHAFLP